MIEYLNWLSNDEADAYRVKVKFSHLRDPNAIAVRRTSLENMLSLITQLERDRWKMEFDNKTGYVKRIELSPETSTFLISADLVDA